ncbi:hypothetical protein BC833DRAFT_622539 [Globomyces pollinis-pini]|nr:hypothetical protein BC833DRAFT_622539 [Globomyces pollinis-pini]
MPNRPIHKIPTFMAHHPSDTLSISSFIATTVYCLIYSTPQNPRHPAIETFRCYIEKILSQTSNNVTPPVIFTSLLYVQRYLQQIKYNIQIRSIDPTVLWTIALILADVSLNDAAYAVKSWAEVSNIPLNVCIERRKQFMEFIVYDLNVTEIQYGNWISHLKQLCDYNSTKLHQLYYIQTNTLDTKADYSCYRPAMQKTNGAYHQQSQYKIPMKNEISYAPINQSTTVHSLNFNMWSNPSVIPSPNFENAKYMIPLDFSTWN